MTRLVILLRPTLSLHSKPFSTTTNCSLASNSHLLSMEQKETAAGRLHPAAFTLGTTDIPDCHWMCDTHSSRQPQLLRCTASLQDSILAVPSPQYFHCNTCRSFFTFYGSEITKDACQLKLCSSASVAFSISSSV